jgi:hypothetical protein
MITKANLFLLALCVLILTACEKNIPKLQKSLTPAEQLLTEKTWKYNEYFTNYSLSTAAVEYKLGKPNNLTDLSPNRVSFNADNSYSEITQQGDTLKGTWRLLQNDTQLEVKNSLGTFLSRLLLFNSTNLVWLDDQRNILARMIPADFNQLPSVTNSKLVGKRWIYQEYFTNFSRTETGLAYKRDKANNLIDLTKNQVQFNVDGSVIEIDEAGNSVPGTWRFITVGAVTGTEVSNYKGRFQAVLVHLDDSSMVWFDPGSDRYAKMSVAANDSQTAVSARARILVNKVWIYTEYFSSYSAPAAQLNYKRDKTTGNPLDLSPSRVTFNLDGSFTEITPGSTTLTGTWQLQENDTKLKTISATGTRTAEIIQLDSTSFTWYDETNNNYGKMNVSPYTPNYSIALGQLTGKTWVYQEYFSNYSSLQAAVVYKRERSVNALDINRNTTLFNTNGTFNEINEAGQAVTGTWQILNGNQLYTVNNLGGTHTATLIMLNEKSLIWYNTTANTYAKMVLKH